MTLFIVLALGLLVSCAFAVVSASNMIPFRHIAWDGRLLNVHQVYNRESLRRVSGLLAGWLPDRATTKLEMKRGLKLLAIAYGGYVIGYGLGFVLDVLGTLIWAVLR